MKFGFSIHINPIINYVWSDIVKGFITQKKIYQHFVIKEIGSVALKSETYKLLKTKETIRGQIQIKLLCRIVAHATMSGNTIR